VATDLTDVQGHKRLNTLEQLVDVFVRTLSVQPDELIAKNQLPSEPHEVKAYWLDLAKYHIHRARLAIDCGDPGRAAESSVIAATYTASILDRASQQRLLSSFGGKQTPYGELQERAVTRAIGMWKSDPDRAVSSIARELHRWFLSESLGESPVERTICRWIRSSKPEIK
jgi:hypothetical protein